jgi:hypothetical protein
VPPPVDGAPTGRPVDPEVPTPLGVGLAVEVGLPVPDAVDEAEADDEPLGVEVAEHEAVGIAEALALADALAEAEDEAEDEDEDEADADELGVAEAEALLVGVQLVVGDGVQDGEGLGELDADALADAEAEADADELGVAEADAVAQLDVAAAATPPHDPANAAIAAETSRVVVPSARPICPAHCSFSQPLCRDRRKIVTFSWVVRFTDQGSQVPRSLHQCLVSQMAGYLDNHRDSR